MQQATKFLPRAPSLKASQCIAIFGPSGSGKTVLLQALLAIAPPEQTYLAYDLNCEYGAYCKWRADSWEQLVEHQTLYLATPARLQILPRDDPENEIAGLAEFLCTLRRTTLVLDEADVYINPAKRLTFPKLRRVLQTGRHRACGVWGCGRRPADVDRLWTAQAHLFVYSLREPRDRDYVEKRAGGPLPWDTLEPFECFSIGDALDGKLKVEASGCIRWRPISA